MGTSQELRRVTAGIALKGISRQSAARALHLSVSALNKKLRGASTLHPEELRRLRLLCQRNMEDAAR